jgi:conjugative transfer signal peptidase TraF
MRNPYLHIAGIAIGAMLVTAVVPWPVRLMWNASASVPVGLYVVAPTRKPRRGDLLAVDPPPEIADLFAERGYLPHGVPLLKYVAATVGQRVCRVDLRITIDGKTVGMARRRDRKDRPLPEWQGCFRLADGDRFLMNAAVADSLDGRYFGVIAAEQVVGRATPVWTDERGDGLYVWRAKSHPQSPESPSQGD